MSDDVDYMSDDVDVRRYLRTGEWLDAQTFPPLRWAVPGLIPEGFGLLTGPPKAGKSWAALGVCLAVASGGRAFGVIPTGQPRPVLVMALEDGERRLQSRCRALLGPGESIPARLHFATQLPPGDVLTVIKHWLNEYGAHTPLVVLDTLGRVMPNSNPGEGAYQRDYRIGAYLKNVVDAHPGATLAVVHHVRKQAGEDWMDSTSGTNGLNGAADWTLNIARPRNERRGLIRITGRDVVEGEYAVTCDDGAWTLDGEDLRGAADTARQRQASEGVSDQSARIVEVVAQHPDGINVTDVGKAVGMEAKHAGTYLSRLTDAGRIRRTKRGIYAPVECVESVESAVQSMELFSTEGGECGNGARSQFHTSTLSTPTEGPTCAERAACRAEATVSA